MVSALFKRSGGFFFGLTASRLITTIVYILLARHFAPHIFGQLILYATLLSIATYFADLGLNQWYQKEVERAEPKQTFHKVLSAHLK
jgi:O-antigen/teichoic acid export membrane protein